MPELPEVEALADHLRRHAVGQTVERVDVASLSALKTAAGAFDAKKVFDGNKATSSKPEVLTAVAGNRADLPVVWPRRPSGPPS